MSSPDSSKKSNSIAIPETDGLADLPAPAESKNSSDIVADDPYGEIDLPAPAGSSDGTSLDSRPPIATPAEDSFGEVDLPAPSGNVDLPQPVGTIDLPAPSGNVDLPQPVGTPPVAPSNHNDDQFGEIDLPTPSNNVTFPPPSKTVDQSAGQKTQAFGQISPPTAPPAPPSIQPPPLGSIPPTQDVPAGEPADSQFGFDDISLSSMSVPPATEDNLTAPAPEVSGPQDDIPGLDSLTFPESLAPPSADTGTNLPASDPSADNTGDMSFGEVNLSPSPSQPPKEGVSFPGISTVSTPAGAPHESDNEFDAFPTTESSPEGEGSESKGLELAHDPFLESVNDGPSTDTDATSDERRPATAFEGRRKWERQGRSIRIMLLAFLGILILVGGGMTFTPLGPFGAYALVNLIPKFGQAEIVEQKAKLVDRRLLEDTPFALDQAIQEVERELVELSDNEDLKLLGVYLHTWHQLRFGADKKHNQAALKLLGPINLNESESPYAPLAAASRQALAGQTSMLVKTLSTQVKPTTNGEVLTIASYLNTGRPDKALPIALTLDKKERSARSGFFLAKALSQSGAHSEAMEKLTKLLKKYPKHADIKLALAERYLWTNPIIRKEILELTSNVITSSGSTGTPQQTAEAHAIVGHLYLLERNMEEAAKEFSKAEKLNPDSVSMLVGKGRIGLLNNDIPAAASAFNKVLSSNPNHLDAQLGIIETFFRENRFADALEVLTTIVPANQTNPRARYLMGIVQLALKNTEPAEQELKTALEIDKTYLEVYVALSELYWATDRNSEAMAILDSASNAISDSPLLRQTLARAYAKLGDYATAIVELSKAIDMDADNIHSYFAMAQMYRQMNSYDDARNALAEVETRNPSFPGLALEKGYLTELAGDIAGALALYEKELQTSKDDIDLKIRIGATSHMLGDNQTAEKYLKEVVAVTPKSAEANYYLGEICRLSGRVVEAIGYHKTAAEQAPLNALYHLRYGMSLQDNHDLRSAMQEYEVAKELNPKLAEVYVRMGSVLLLQGAAKDAFQYLETGLNLDAVPYDAYWLMADSFEQRGELRAAANHYRKAVKAAPKEAELYFRLGRVELKVYGTRTALPSLLKSIQLVDDAGQTPAWLPEALYRLGVAQENRGHKTKARDTFKRYLDIAPENDIDRSEVTARLERLSS